MRCRANKIKRQYNKQKAFHTQKSFKNDIESQKKTKRKTHKNSKYIN